MTRKLRLWLLFMDVTRCLFGFGSRPYLWAVARAAACVDYEPIVADRGEEPW